MNSTFGVGMLRTGCLFDLDLQSVDGRLPSLDDGLSWPALLDNYTFTSYDGQFVLMRRNRFIHPSSSYDDVSTKRYKTGATVVLPNDGWTGVR
jgi:hypothetical protein